VLRLSNCTSSRSRNARWIPPRRDEEGAGYGPDAAAMANASAVAFLFGREIFETQGVPVGIVLSCKGGTRAVNWTSREVLAQNPDAAGHYRYHQELVEAFPAALDEWVAAGRENSPPAGAAGPQTGVRGRR
jgi:hypothetical protein